MTVPILRARVTKTQENRWGRLVLAVRGEVISCRCLELRVSADKLRLMQLSPSISDVYREIAGSVGLQVDEYESVQLIPAGLDSYLVRWFAKGA